MFLLTFKLSVQKFHDYCIFFQNSHHFSSSTQIFKCPQNGTVLILLVSKHTLKRHMLGTRLTGTTLIDYLKCGLWRAATICFCKQNFQNVLESPWPIVMLFDQLMFCKRHFCRILKFSLTFQLKLKVYKIDFNCYFTM